MNSEPTYHNWMYHNWTDQDGNPAGGCASGRGFSISWQNGPLGRDGGRKEPNGAFVEDVIAAAMNRLLFYQDSKFNCEENAAALGYLSLALRALDARTNRREAENTEGTHQGS